MKVKTRGCDRAGYVTGRHPLWLGANFARSEARESERFSSQSLKGRELGQALYMLGSIESSGRVSEAAKTRAGNELLGIALEQLGAPFSTEFSYKNTERGLAAEDGQIYTEVVEDGLKHARKNAKVDPALMFMVNRAENDVALANYFQQMPVGMTAILSSPCPDPEEVGASTHALSEFNYRPDVDQAMVWIGTRTEQGLTLCSVNLFHATPDKLAQTLSEVTGSVVDLGQSREAMTGNIISLHGGSGEDIARSIVDTFDANATHEYGENTNHGLKVDESITRHNKEAQIFLEHPDFIRMHLSSLMLMEQVAQSLYDERSHIPQDYLNGLLEMKKPDGTHELETEQRIAVHNLLKQGALVSDEEFILAMQAVSRGACASLWATMAKIYIQAESGQIEGLETTVGGSSAGDNISIQGLKIVEAVRKSGQQSHGCPGGGNAQRSIFSMDESAAAETLLATQTIKTNCPFCHEKVTAEITKGTITCKTCDACVEVCGGKVRRKSNKKYLAKRTFRKNFKLFGEKSKSAKEAMNVKKQKAGNWLSGLLFGQ